MTNYAVAEAEELFAELTDIGYEESQVPYGDDMLFITERECIIPTLAMSVRVGTYYNKEVDEDGKVYYEPDFNVSLLYAAGEQDVSQYLYFEQDPVGVAISNFFNTSVGMEMKDRLERKGINTSTFENMLIIPSRKDLFELEKANLEQLAVKIA